MPDESERVTVSTYVPPSQRDAWREDAESMGMSQSEFIRSMVQAGRRSFSLGGSSESPVEADVAGPNPRSNDRKTVVLELLRERGPLEWDDLVEALAGDLEDELETALVELQGENRIQHSGRRGGYALAGDTDGE